MRMARLELAWREPHAPQACVSTDSTTSALFNQFRQYNILPHKVANFFPLK
jgi:hypothetical protein